MGQRPERRSIHTPHHEDMRFRRSDREFTCFRWSAVWSRDGESNPGPIHYERKTHVRRANASTTL